MMLRDKDTGKITSLPIISGILMLKGKKSPFLRAFESGDVEKAAFEMKSLPGKPSSQFDVLLRLALSTGNIELGKKVGVEAFGTLRKTDILHILSSNNGPSDKIAFFVEIMRAKHDGLKPAQLLYLHKTLEAYYELYFRCGNGLPKTWLSFFIEDIYKYNSRNTISKYLGMYSTKAPSTYEQNVAAFLVKQTSKDLKLLKSLAFGSYCRRRIQYETLHALNLVSPEHAKTFAELIIQRQLHSNAFYDFRTTEFAQKIKSQDNSVAKQPRVESDVSFLFRCLKK